MDIQGKVFIVTGGASGLGEGTARALAAKGGKVVIADMQADKGEAIARELGGRFVRCDVSSEADGQAVVAQAVAMVFASACAWGVLPVPCSQRLVLSKQKASSAVCQAPHMPSSCGDCQVNQY